jgi:Sec-independent protein translocase protein TatA
MTVKEGHPMELLIIIVILILLFGGGFSFYRR